MRSVKRGRGPSFMAGIVTLLVAVFGLFFIVDSSSGGAPGMFVLFGFVFVVVALAGAAYNFYNATARNRLSEFDLTGDEEPDPIGQPLGHAPAGRIDGAFCPYCGAGVEDEFEFCPECGKDI